MMKEKSNKKHRLPLFILHNDSTSKTLTEKLNYPKPDELLTVYQNKLVYVAK